MQTARHELLHQHISIRSAGMSLLICGFKKKKKEKRKGEGGGGGEEEANASRAQGSMEVHITLVIFSYLWLESFAAPIH